MWGVEEIRARGGGGKRSGGLRLGRSKKEKGGEMINAEDQQLLGHSRGLASIYLSSPLMPLSSAQRWRWRLAWEGMTMIREYGVGGW